MRAAAVSASIGWKRAHAGHAACTAAAWDAAERAREDQPPTATAAISAATRSTKSNVASFDMALKKVPGKERGGERDGVGSVLWPGGEGIYRKVAAFGARRRLANAVARARTRTRVGRDCRLGRNGCCRLAPGQGALDPWMGHCVRRRAQSGHACASIHQRPLRCTARFSLPTSLAWRLSSAHRHSPRGISSTAACAARRCSSPTLPMPTSRSPRSTCTPSGRLAASFATSTETRPWRPRISLLASGRPLPRASWADLAQWQAWARLILGLVVRDCLLQLLGTRLHRPDRGNRDL